MKAISAVIATIMLLMITVSLVGVFYVFSSTLATQSTSSGSEQASQLTAQLSMCMQVDNIIGNQITLRNCGKGVIENKSLVVMIDDIALGANANTQTILEGNSSAVNISGLWNVPFGKHSLKISNGAAVALALVEIIPNPDGLAGSWNFDEGTGAIAYDASGNGNVGALNNMNTSGNATSGWADGKFESGLQFDGVNDYVDAGNGAILNTTDKMTISAWIYPSLSGRYAIYRGSNFGIYYVTNEFKVNVNGLFTKGADSLPLYPVNNWYHVVFVRDNMNTVSNLYINGILDGNTTNNESLNWGTANLLFGTSSNGFNGTIDEVRIWNRALAPDETVTMKRII
ncbi:MAG: LamG domain-containing protein [Candidatus Aenigmatarchaeota archaeon]